MAAVSDVTTLGASVRPSDAETPPAAALDGLPVKILAKIASSLNCRALLSLEDVSEKCRHAVTLRLGNVNVFKINEGNDNDFEDQSDEGSDEDSEGGDNDFESLSGEGSDEDSESPMVIRADRAMHDDDFSSEWELLSCSQKESILSRLTGLRELYVNVSEVGDAEWLLEALVAASTGWSQLEKLSLEWCDEDADDSTVSLDPTLLGQLCSNCTRLTDVALDACVTDRVVEAVLETRHGELRSLELVLMDALSQDRLSAGLASCVRLERLLMCELSMVSNCLPLGGLPALRHLILKSCTTSDADLALLVERQPGLESVHLHGCHGDDLTRDGLALLGRLPALRSLVLSSVDVVSDWLLDQLSQAPLTELVLAELDRSFWAFITAKGLLRLSQSCPALRWVTLWKEGSEKRSGDAIKIVDCRSAEAKRDLPRMFKKVIKSNEFCSKVCRLSADPPGKGSWSDA